MNDCLALIEKWQEKFKEKNLTDKILSTFDEDSWKYISANVCLSRNFIKNYKDKLDWELLTSRQTLTFEFIREFKDYVDWEYISRIPNLSDDFIREFADKLNWSHNKNPKISR